MGLDVVITESAEEKLDNIIDYLENNWGSKTKTKFLEQFKKDVEYVSEYPYLFPESDKKQGVRKCVLDRYTIMYYKVATNRVEVIMFHYTRQDPNIIGW